MSRCLDGQVHIWAAAIPVRCARCGQPPVALPPVSMEVKIRRACEQMDEVSVIVKAVIAEARDFCTDQQDVPAEVAKRLDWQLDNLEKRALEALEDRE